MYKSRPMGLLMLASLLISLWVQMDSIILPRSSPGNIYYQQQQMHRFAADYYKGNVAVNDLGWVAYKNDNYKMG